MEWPIDGVKVWMGRRVSEINRSLLQLLRVIMKKKKKKKKKEEEEKEGTRALALLQSAWFIAK